MTNTAHHGASPQCPFIDAALTAKCGAEAIRSGANVDGPLRRRSALGLTTRLGITTWCRQPWVKLARILTECLTYDRARDRGDQRNRSMYNFDACVGLV